MFKKNQILYTARKLDLSSTGGPIIPLGAKVTVLRVRRDGRLWVDIRNFGQRHLELWDTCIYLPLDIRGKQYGSRGAANRAINKFRVKYFATIPKGYQFWVNQIDEGCHEVCGASR